MKEVNKISLVAKKQRLGALEKVNTKLARSQRQHAYWQTLDRKRDTRLKLQWGDLIKKSGLDQEDPSIILGLLLEAAEILKSNEAEAARKRWRATGDTFLTEEAPSSPSSQQEKKHHG